MSDTEEVLDNRKRICCPKRCPGICSEPVAKRTRRSLRQLNEKIEEEERSNEPIILDKLNEDCWRILFGYIDVKQLILSERVCQRWRIMVQQYLKRITICLRSNRYQYDSVKERPGKHRKLTVPPRFYLGVVEKLGRSIVEADCFDAAGLKSLGRQCPDIEDLRILEPKFHQVKNLVVHFKKLKNVTFRDVIHLGDNYVSKFLQVNTPRKLVISKNVRISGICLTSLKTNLTALGIHTCQYIDIIYMLLAADKLADLTELRMSGNSYLVMADVFMLIEKTPKLRHLSLEWLPGYTIWETVDVGGLVDAICKLKHLRHLSFRNNDTVKDEWLEPIGRCCTELKVVDIGSCSDVTAAGIDALCRGVAGTLTELVVTGNDCVSNDDVMRWIYQCPNLEILDVHFCNMLTRDLVEQCRQAALLRPRALRLLLFGTNLEQKEYGSVDYWNDDGKEEKYDNLILDFSLRSVQSSDSGSMIYLR